jgi:hypothetical protein
LIDDDLRHRARRLSSGDHRVEDLDRLYLGQRTRSWNHSAFREIGDFVAHRDVRDKGLVTQAGRDVFTSIDVWSLPMRGRKPSWADIERAAQANLRLASDDQLIAGCGCRRPTARKRLASALGKVDRKETPTQPEFRVLDFLGNRFIWKPAFNSDQLFSEFADVLLRNRIVEKPDLAALSGARAFLILHAVAVMHGSSIVLENGHRARLLAGYANKERRLEVKMEISFADLGKPLMAPICLFLTDLQPEGHCLPILIAADEPAFADHWNTAIEVTPDGYLTPVS